MKMSYQHRRVSRNFVAIQCGDTVAALDICPDQENVLVAAAGRPYLKVFSVYDHNFVEKSHLRSTSNPGINYAQDVAWNQFETACIATGTSSGDVVIWNLQKQGIDRIYSHHERSLNRIDFHPSDPKLLLSGAFDGIAIFDLREEKPVQSWPSNGQLRCIQYNPIDPNLFIAGMENFIEIWDIRMHKRMQASIVHSGSVLSCDWHPAWKNVFATGGLDNIIKIWKVNENAICEVRQIQALDSVSFIKWRPMNNYHLASCSLLQDFSVHLWDYRRPYLSYYMFDQHTSPVTSVAWKRSTDEASPVFFSGSRNGNVIMHKVKCGIQHNEGSLSQTVSISSNDMMINSNKMKGRSKPSKYFDRNSFHLQQSGIDSSLEVLSAVQIAEKFDSFSDSFKICAESYLLTGQKIVDMCQKNLEVALNCSLRSIAGKWEFLKKYIECNVSDTFTTVSSSIEDEYDLLNSQATICAPYTTDETCVFEETALLNSTANSPGNIRAVTGNRPDIFFGDHFGKYEDDDRFFDAHPQVTIQPYERRTSPIKHIINDNLGKNHFELDSMDEDLIPISDELKQFVVTLEVEEFQLPEAWDLIFNQLQLSVEEGDVQFSVSAILVMRDILKETCILKVQENVRAIEEWFYSYIDLLTSVKLYAKANEVINLAPLESIRSLNQQSTTIYSKCLNCKKAAPNPLKCWNKTCKVLKCCFCKLPVKSHYVWCFECTHGGHRKHLDEWFKKYDFCPAGCGHKCKYSL